MKIVKNFINEYRKIEELEGRILYIFAPVTILVCFFAFVLALFEGTGLITTILCALWPIITTLVFLVTRKNKKYFLGLGIIGFFIIFIVVPFSFFTYGGINSAMPVLLACTTVLSTVCVRKKYRITACFISVFVNTLCVAISIYCPDLVIEIPEDVWALDYVISFAAFNIALQIVVSYLINQTILYTKIVDSHMDIKVAEALDPKRGNDNISGIKKAAVLFIDISHFTTNTEDMETEKIRDYLNYFFEICDFYITQNDGVLDKYIGDCAMAYWIDDGDVNAALNATLSAKQICVSLDSVRLETKEKFGHELLCSAGISYGEVLVGDIGTNKRKNFTAIGDTVNLASRLEALAKENVIYISGEVVKRLAGSILVEKTDIKGVRGKKEEVSIYQVIM